MTVQQGPALCEDFLPYSEKDAGFVVCHGNLPCNRKHALDREVADQFHDWGYNQALTEVYYCIQAGMPLYALKDFVEEGRK